MNLTEFSALGVNPIDLEAIRCGWLLRGSAWRFHSVGFDAKRGAEATAANYQLANTHRHISLRVLLRLTAMDVCCGPPSANLLTV